MSEWLDDEFDDASVTVAHVSAGFAPSRSYRVAVLSGPDAGASGSVDGRGPGPVLVGQSRVCGLQLADRTVSRRHAQFDVIAGELRVSDLESKNGTFLAGARVTELRLKQPGQDRLHAPGTTPLPATQSPGRSLGSGSGALGAAQW